jgi:hypothetical protein
MPRARFAARIRQETADARRIARHVCKKNAWSADEHLRAMRASLEWFRSTKTNKKPGSNATRRSAAMPSIRAVHVNCTHCEHTFPSTLRFADVDAFDKALRVGFMAQCPNCYQIVSCDRRNISLELDGGHSPLPATE